MSSGSRQAPVVGVDRLQPGDHAFLAFSDDAGRWDILGIFTQQGLSRDEKVFLNVDAGHPSDIAAQITGGMAAARKAIDSGQLVISTAPPPGRDGFDAGQLAHASRERLEAAAAEGFRGIRTANELSLSLVPADDLGQVMEFEKAMHQALLAGTTGVRYTTLCHWDERRFGDGPALDAIRAIHPVTVLPRTGTLHVAWDAIGVRITGDSDLSTRAEFTSALEKLAEKPATGHPLVLDISDLSFLDAHSAGAILRLAAALSPPRHLEVRCRGHHRRLLHVLGARTIRQLSVITDRLPLAPAAPASVLAESQLAKNQ
jgi:hypothetical protein